MQRGLLLHARACDPDPHRAKRHRAGLFGSAYRLTRVRATYGSRLQHRVQFTSVSQGVPAIGSQHFCLGSRVAELQLKVLFEELLKRFPDIHASGPVRRLRSNFIAGIKEMPVKLTA